MNERDIIVEYNRKSYIGKTLYASPRGLPYDIAVIEVKTSDFNGMLEFKLPTCDCVEGITFLVGYWCLRTYAILGVKSRLVFVDY